MPKKKETVDSILSEQAGVDNVPENAGHASTTMDGSFDNEPVKKKKKKKKRKRAKRDTNAQVERTPETETETESDITISSVPGSETELETVESSTEEMHIHTQPIQTGRHSQDGKSRTININSQHQPEKFIGNSISTAKYSILSFVPAFLYEQFRRYSNIFFLSIVLLQQIPDVSPTGKYTTLVPLLFILSVSAMKEIIEDVKRHKADSEVNNREVEVLIDGEWKGIKWRKVGVGDFVKIKNDMFFPADIVLFSSSEPQGLCYIETSNLDGETSFKVRQGLPQTARLLETTDFSALTGFLECELPNRHLYEYAGKVKLNDGPELPLGLDQILLRGAKLQNTSWILGMVVYTGHDTKLMKNSTAAPLKRSTVDKLTNTQIIMLFFLLIIIALSSATFSVLLIDTDTLWYIPKLSSSDNDANAGILKKMHIFLYNVLTFVILYNNLIPISLTVTLEVVRFTQALFINWDIDMYHAESDTPAMARTSNLNEELGQVRYIFSDKTGTLTCNIMEFKACTVGGKIYLPETLFDGRNDLIDNLKNKDATANDIRDFMILLSVCHTVIPEYVDGDVIYHAASPDERALVSGAKHLGYEFQTRTPSDVEIKALDELEKYEILNVLEFTSTRKRMSVIVRAPDDKIRLYCKGADSVIYERLTGGSSESVKVKTQEHLEEFATQGLRTLCCAVTDISQRAYDEWNHSYHKAATAINNREQKLEEVSNLIEKNLRLLGATAIEDKLQDKVPETIASLLKAGISVWVLTGDKQETAINIGYSCRLLNQSMELITLNRDSLNATRECILSYIRDLSQENGGTLPKENDAAVIVDGKTLHYALHADLRRDFLDLCCSCRAVICCRASPIQKAEIVQYVTQQTGAVTLAIGDGANDVAMIQKAHVGVGISGQEGLQASCASDYAIAQFHFLRKLLFVHGAWNYDRMCKLIFYSYYKNVCLYVIELWFAIYSAWSGQIIFERWTIGLYNMLFTCAQPICLGLFERDCSEQLRLRYPILYRPPVNPFSLKVFFTWIANSIFHSVVIFWLSLGIYGDGVVWGDGKEGGYLVLGNFIYTYVVVIVSLKSGLETKSWTIFTHISIWGSIIFWMLFLLGYSYVYALIPFGAEIFGVGPLVYSSPIFWVGLILVPTATLLPDVMKKTFDNTMYKTIGERLREFEKLGKNPTAQMQEVEVTMRDDMHHSDFSLGSSKAGTDTTNSGSTKNSSRPKSPP